MVVVQGHEVVS